MEQSKEDRIKDIKKRIAYLNQQQYAIKIIINSIYGAFGNKWFNFHDRNIAQSITLQGQDLIKYSIAAVNYYFRERWHLDKELHEHLGISHLKINKPSIEGAIYSDTDSTYINFDLAYSSIENYQLSNIKQIEFNKKIIDFRFSSFLNNAFKEYSSSYNTENHMNFALENISYSGIWTGKKHYVIKIADHRDLTAKYKIKARGIGLAQASIPKWARDQQRKLVEIMLDKGKETILEKDIIPHLKKMRKGYENNDVEDISFNKFVKKYNEYVPDDTVLEIPKGMPINSRASLYYNFMINETKIGKYYKIREGAKIKFYYAKHSDNEEMNVFGYIPGNYPIEFAFPVDYNEQFFQTVVEPVNKLLVAMGSQAVDRSLKRSVKYNAPKVKRTINDDDLYPLYVINNETLEYKEIPRILYPYILNSLLEVPKKHEDEYIASVSTYGLLSEVVPKFELAKYIKRKRNDQLKKKQKTEFFSQLTEMDKEVYVEFSKKIKAYKPEKGTYGFIMNNETLAPVVKKTYSKFTYELSLDFLKRIKNYSVNGAIHIINDAFIVADAPPPEEIEQEANESQEKTE